MGPQNITIEDDDGYRITITVWDCEVSNSSISQIQTKYNQNIYYLWANGNLGYYEEGNEWQVEPLSIESIILAHSSNYDGEFIANSIESKTAINHEPYVIIPTLGETLDYNFSFPDNSRVIVRIFDISGKFVTSLIDKYYEQSGTVYCNNPPASWDGKNHLGQIMNPGTYIMHIEAMNPNTGKTETDASPIVVGVKNQNP